MNTRNILLVSSDRDLSETVKISALTFTKLNCQISLENADDHVTALEKSKPVNLDLILIDNDTDNVDSYTLISDLRKDANAKNKKIILIYSGSVNKEKIFKAGCDSIMNKDEFKRVVNNILLF